MLSLSPAKILVILIVALIVLGPEKLPQMARQLGSLWHDLRQWRGRIESEVRGTFPNLPPADEVARAVRSPLAFLDRLADEHERTLAEEEAAHAGPDAAVPPATPAESGDGAPVAGANGAMRNGGPPSRDEAAPPSHGNGAGPAPPVWSRGQTAIGTGVEIPPDDPSMN